MLILVALQGNDYYPFGMSMPGRKFSDANRYRYGFNGKENDNEVKGEGNQQDYGMRIYDGRIGRFLSVDPLSPAYPYYTPYQFAGNTPVRFIDLDGAERAAPEEVARAKKYLSESISSYIVKNQVYTKFKTISGNNLVEQLKNALSDPGQSFKKQADEVGNMCGVYAFSYLFAIYKPTEFIQGVASLYITGEMETNDMVTSAINGIENKIGDVSNQSLPVFIFGGSIRDRSNQFLGYKGLAHKYWGATNTSTMKSWITDFLGAEVSEISLPGSGDSRNKMIQDLTDHVNSGKDLVVRVSATIYKNTSNNVKRQIGDGLEAGISRGDHWVVINGKMSFDKGNQTLTISSFDMNQGIRTFTLSVQDFEDMTYDILKVERKKE